MSTTMIFPRTQALQAASIYTQQASAQQTGGIDISTLMNLMLPAMVVGMMAKAISTTPSKKKEVTPTTENPTSQPKEAKKSG
jgi:large-conductance mechanosensitive channel